MRKWTWHRYVLLIPTLLYVLLIVCLWGFMWAIEFLGNVAENINKHVDPIILMPIYKINRWLRKKEIRH
jgi:hypothetical protein